MVYLELGGALAALLAVREPVRADASIHHEFSRIAPVPHQAERGPDALNLVGAHTIRFCDFGLPCHFQSPMTNCVPALLPLVTPFFPT